MFLGLGLVGGRVGRKVDEIMIIVEDPADLLDIWRASRLDLCALIVDRRPTGTPLKMVLSL